MIAQSEMLQTQQLKIEMPIASGEAQSSGFGDALAQATAANGHHAAPASAGSHAAKKPAEKKTEEAQAASAKSEKATQTTVVQASVPAQAKAAVPMLPLHPLAADGEKQVDEAASKGEINGTSESGHAAAYGKDGAAKLEGATSMTTLHQPAPRQAGDAGDGSGSDSSARDLASDEVSSRSASVDGDSTSDVDGQGAGQSNATLSDGDTAMMLGIAPPTVALASDFGASDPGLTGSESAAVMDLSLSGLSGAASGASKSGVPGGGSAAAKSKPGISDANSSAPAGFAAFQKVPEAVQAFITTSDGAAANANAAQAQTNVHPGMTGAGASEGNAKATQQESGAAGTESGGTTASASGTPQSWDASATQVVHRAQLIQAMHQSEMRMGMNSAEFGNISISAAVSHQTLSAQISLNHAELSRALTAQLPEIEKRLGSAYGLPSRVEIRDGSSTAQQGSSQREGGRSQDSVRGISNVSQSGLSSASVMRESASTTTYSPSAGMRLDILI